MKNSLTKKGLWQWCAFLSCAFFSPTENSLGESLATLSQRLIFVPSRSAFEREKARAAAILPETLKSKRAGMAHRNNNFSERAAFTAIALYGSIFLGSCSNLAVQSHPVT